MFTVYILQCSDNSYYTGYTKDLVKRLECHQQGRGSKYVYSRLPFKLVYQENFPTQKEAMQKEYQIKKKKRHWKEKLILSGITPDN